MTTFYLVKSSEGLEGSFTTAADAAGYRDELQAIGISGLTIHTKAVDEPMTTQELLKHCPGYRRSDYGRLPKCKYCGLTEAEHKTKATS